MRGLRRVFESKPGLCWLSLILSLASNLIALLSYLRILTIYSASDDVGLFFILYFIASTGVAIAVFVVPRISSTRILVGLRIALLAGILGISPLNTAMGMLLIAPLIMEICIYEQFPGNLIISFALSVLAIGISGRLTIREADRFEAAAFAETVLRFGNYLLFLPLLSLAFSMLTKYREERILDQEEIGRLNTAVSRLAKTNLEYQEYASRAEQVSMLEERNRITREIHDAIGYTMTNNIMMMEAASDMVHRHPERVRKLMETARQTAQQGLEDIRNALHLLRAQEVPSDKGTAAFVKLIKVFETATGTEVEIELGNIPWEFSLKVEYVIYHFIQEALTNSFRHGMATKVRILFWMSDSTLIVTVRDNGRGSEQIQEGIGIAGMRERLEQVSGFLEAANVDDGFQITATIPIGADG